MINVLITGNITQQYDYPLPYRNSQIFILDVRNYTWVRSFDVPTTTIPTNTTSNPSVTNNPPTQTSSTTNSLESNEQLTTMKIVIAAIGSILGTIVLLTIGFFGYKCYRRRESVRTSEVARVHGNTQNIG